MGARELPVRQRKNGCTLSPAARRVAPTAGLKPAFDGSLQRRGTAYSRGLADAALGRLIQLIQHTALAAPVLTCTARCAPVGRLDGALGRADTTEVLDDTST